MAELSPILKQATPVVADRGEGSYLYDVDGHRHLDLTAGIGVTSTGHCHPRVVRAAQDQVGQLIHGQYSIVMHQPLRDLTQRLGAVLPPGIDSLFFANSGSEAIEAALRLVRQVTGRPNVIVFQGGFHGRTVATASMTTSATRFTSGVSPLMDGVHMAPFPYAYHYGWDENTTTDFVLRELDYLFATRTAPDQTAAFFVEPMLGEGGYVPANTEFLAGLRQRADEHGILLVIDEIQTGCGRTGRFWAHQHFAGRPDVITTAKGLASGFPLSAMATSQELMAQVPAGTQGGTYGGNAVSCAAALATLDVIEEEDLVENAAQRGRQLLDGARRIGAHTPQIGDVRGLGLLVGTEFTTSGGTPDAATAQAAQQAAANRGLLLLTGGSFGNVVRMVPPLVVTADQIDQALQIWSDSLAAVT